VNYVPHKDVYMILGVTGPNEYENNVNNNWYTNRMAVWCLTYTLEVLTRFEKRDPGAHARFTSDKGITPDEQTAFRQIIDKMYYPEDPDRGIFLQQDGFLDKDLTPVSELAPEHLPLNQNWSWDRILRSCYIKQADVLQGLFFLSDQYDLETKKRNYDFYEPLTVHESSLSPCIYSIIASDLGYETEAYKHYQRSARLDLDNYNNDTEDGLHITSMAGTWMSIVYGFGGLHVSEDLLHLRPFIPGRWERYAFRIVYRGRLLSVVVTDGATTLTMLEGADLDLVVYGERRTLESKRPLVCQNKGGDSYDE
jgi:maltose phosphorylase